MATEDLFIRLGLKGQAAVSKGLKQTASETRSVGTAAETAGAKAQIMGAKFTTASDKASVSMGKLVGAIGIVAGAQGLGRLAIAGTKWGLSFNAQVESARLRFGLFTDDVNGLTKAVQRIDMNSAFNFADLADAAALLGNSGVRDIPDVLQGIANAAAAGGKGTEGFKSTALAIAQIAAKGKLSQEEINQLNEAGAPGAQRTIAKHFNLTAKELGNLGGQGLDAKEAIQALTAEWTSGKMARAASAQTKTLGGQWVLLTGNMQKTAGAATESLAKSLEKDVLPAANRATEQITKIFGKEGLSNEEKLRRARAVITRELGPFADDLKVKLDEADIPGHLGSLVGKAIPIMAQQAASGADDVAKAFVDAWLKSGPWVQLLTALAVWKKLGTPGLPGKGGKGGALGGAASKLTPTPVFVTNWGGMPGGKGVPGIPGKVDKTPGWGKTARSVGRFAGPVGVAVTAAEVIHALFPNFGSRDVPSRAGGATVRRQSERQIPAPGFGGGMPGMPPVVIQVEGRTIATAKATADARQRARK